MLWRRAWAEVSQECRAERSESYSAGVIGCVGPGEHDKPGSLHDRRFDDMSNGIRRVLR
jgi:hypothetical protein